MISGPVVDRKPRVVIIGAGFAGLSAARALKGAPVEVTVIDRNNHHLFQPLLYQVATAGLAPNEVAQPIRQILKDRKNTRVLLGEVKDIDTEDCTVYVGSRVLQYDYLIVAAGSRHSYFAHPDWEPYAPGLKTIDDALEIRRRILLAFEKAEYEPDAEKRKALLTFVVVGGGPSGVELAGAISEIACKVMAGEFRNIKPHEARTFLVEAGPRILASFPPSLSEKAKASLTSICVQVRENSPVTAIEAGKVLVGREWIPSATVLWAAGVSASSLGRMVNARLDRVGRVLVSKNLAVPDNPQVYVVGDLASFTQDGVPLPGLASVAMQQGHHAAENILRDMHVQPLVPFRYRDRGMMATIGRARAVAKLGRSLYSGGIAWYLWLFVHLIKLVGFRNRIFVFLDWTFAYFGCQRPARIVLGNQPPNRPEDCPVCRDQLTCGCLTVPETVVQWGAAE